ncbi:hypothetical protein MLPF_2895 [Mycobacterium lepromatosis]|nr:hypothetical protein MLPF_2895 [Mycobacterium lepromatosis]
MLVAAYPCAGVGDVRWLRVRQGTHAVDHSCWQVMLIRRPATNRKKLSINTGIATKYRRQFVQILLLSAYQALFGGVGRAVGDRCAGPMYSPGKWPGRSTFSSSQWATMSGLLWDWTRT